MESLIDGLKKTQQRVTW